MDMKLRERKRRKGLFEGGYEDVGQYVHYACLNCGKRHRQNTHFCSYECCDKYHRKEE